MTKRPSLIAKVVTVVTIATLAIGIAPKLAEAQASGIMQVSASVVSTHDAFRALQAAREAVSNVSRPVAERRTETAPTVAQVSVARDPRAVVVTINYSRS